MKTERENLLAEACRFGLVGLFLLAVVLLTPHEGSTDGRSFLAAASHSSWRELWDWPAVWGSLKLIILCAGVFSLVFALCAFWIYWMAPRFVGWVLVVMTAGALLGFWMGLYYLAKAAF